MEASHGCRDHMLPSPLDGFDASGDGCGDPGDARLRGWRRRSALLIVAGLLFGCEDAQRSTFESGADADVPSGMCAFLVCDDGDPCTADSCDPDAGCRHDPSPAPGCGPSCTPVARSLGITRESTQGYTRAVLAPPGFLYRVTLGRIEVYAAPSDGPVTPVHVVWAGVGIKAAAWADDRLYLAAGSAGVLVYDIVDRRRPHLIGQYSTVGEAQAIQAHGDLIYVAAGHGGLRILDVSDPTAITLVGAIDTDTFDDLIALDHVRGRVVLRGGFVTRIIDVSDPARPIERSSFGTGGIEPGMRIVQPEGWLHTDGAYGGEVIDMADPESLAFYRMPGRGKLGARRPEGVYRLRTYGRLELFEMRDLDHLEAIREWHFGGSDGDFVVFGEPPRVALLSGGTMDIRDLDADPSAEPQATFTGGGGGSGLVRIGSRVYVNEAFVGLTAVDVTDPATPTRVDAPYEAEHSMTELAAGDGYVVVFELNTGLVILDVSAPAAPVEIGRVPFEFSASVGALGIGGGHLWMAGLRGAQRFRLSPDGVRLDAELTWERAVGGLAPLADPDWAAVSVRDAVLMVHRTADGLAVAAELSWRGDGGWVARAGDRVYVAGGPAGLLVVDVSDPAAPRVMDQWRGGAVDHVTAHAERVVVRNEDESLWVLEVTPDGLGPAHRVRVRSRPRAVELGPDGRTLYVTGYDAVLEVAQIGCE